MSEIRISAVKYANTYPFIYGMKESGFDKKVILETDHPADCARKLISRKVDIGLIPVAALPMVENAEIIGDYCIGANGRVRTVMMFSNSHIEDIENVYLDYRSRTSVNLVKVLARNKWKRSFNWINTSEGFDFAGIKGNEATVLIGDQCFEYEDRFPVSFDLAQEWKDHTGLPFVFACWTANREIDPGFRKEFNEALRTGVKNIPAVVDMFGKKGVIQGETLKKYLSENIDYILDDRKREAISLFLKLLGEL